MFIFILQNGGQSLTTPLQLTNQTCFVGRWAGHPPSLLFPRELWKYSKDLKKFCKMVNKAVFSVISKTPIDQLNPPLAWPSLAQSSLLQPSLAQSSLVQPVEEGCYTQLNRQNKFPVVFFKVTPRKTVGVGITESPIHKQAKFSPPHLSGRENTDIPVVSCLIA